MYDEAQQADFFSSFGERQRNSKQKDLCREINLRRQNVTLMTVAYIYMSFLLQNNFKINK